MTPRPCSSLLAFPSAGIRMSEHHCEDKVFLYLNKSVHRTGWYEQRRPEGHRVLCWVTAQPAAGAATV